MHTMPSWNLDATSILTRRELAAVLTDLSLRVTTVKSAIFSRLGKQFRSR